MIKCLDLKRGVLISEIDLSSSLSSGSCIVSRLKGCPHFRVRFRHFLQVLSALVLSECVVICLDLALIPTFAWLLRGF